jgi:hypothetical protein
MNQWTFFQNVSFQRLNQNLEELLEVHRKNNTVSDHDHPSTTSRGKANDRDIPFDNMQSRSLQSETKQDNTDVRDKSYRDFIIQSSE